MAEIAAAASVIAVIQITDRIVGLCKSYIETVKDVTSDLRLILLEVSTLKTIFENLDFLIAHNCGVSTAVSTLSGKDGAIEGCCRSITELEKLFPSDWKPTAGENTSKKQRVKATWVALAWPLKENKAKKLLDEIMRYKATITLAVTTDSVQDIKDIKIKTLEMHHMLTDDQCQEVYKWLQHTDPSPLHHLAQKLYEPGTGDWILRSPQWATWLEAKQRCLWVHGIPGAGKTVLMSHLITQVQQHCDREQDGKRACVYYYCYYGHGQDEAVPFLRWLINQLCREADVVPGNVYNMYKYGGEPSLVVLLNALEELLQEFEIAYVIVDAIDESNPREDLLKVFRDLATDLRFEKIQLLASSREYIDIERIMEGFSVSLSMANDFVQEDIRIHVRHKLESNPKFTRWSPDLLHEVEEAVSIGARGMFRWAVCQLDIIQRLKGELHVVQKALKDLPKTLDETYDRVLLTIPEEDQQFVHYTLQLILHHNDLYDGNLRGNFSGGIPCALLIKGVERSIAGSTSDRSDRFYNHEILRELCGCLINVTSEHTAFNDRSMKLFGEKKARSEFDDHTVSFAHYTVREYLGSNRISKTSTAYVTSCKEDLKQHFMRMMFSEALQTTPNEEGRNNNRRYHKVEDHFKTYCVASTLYSLRNCSAEIVQHVTLSGLAIDLLNPSKAHFRSLKTTAGSLANFGYLDLRWWSREARFWDLVWRRQESTNIDAMHLLNLLLLAYISPEYVLLARRFLHGKNNKDVLTARLTFGISSSHLRCVYNFDESIIEVFAQLGLEGLHIFRLLLELGTGLFDPSKILLLFSGCHQCHSNYDCNSHCLVERLLELGADPNTNGCWVSPLQIAVGCYDLKAVTSLLKAGANANPIGKSDGNAWEDGTPMSRFNRLHGTSPLSIHRYYPVGPNGDEFLYERYNLSERRGDLDRIRAILLQYEAKSY